MKIYIGQNASPSVGGMYRVFDSLYSYLPKYGVEIVNKAEKADVLNPHIALFDKLPQDKPLVVSSHGLFWADNPWSSTHAWKTNSLCLDSYLQADVITAPSQFVADTISRHTAAPVRVVRHGIDINQWKPNNPQPSYVLWNKSRVDPANEIDDVLRLAAQMPHLQFYLTVGASSLPNVKIIGKTDPDEMLNLVQNALVYLDTPRESGGPCFGVLEAMALGVPVLSWDYGGTAEVIQHTETGYLAKPGDLGELMQGLNYCLQYREQIASAAYDTLLNKYTVEHSISGYIAAYEEAHKKFYTPVKVSVITPCYNLAAFLPNAVDSVLHQSMEDWELILVDDASTDNSKEVIAQQAERDPRIRALYNPSNLHVSDSRNRAIWEARGKYILPLDADDRLTPNALKLLAKQLDENRSLAIATGKLELFSEDDLTKGRVGPWPNDTNAKLQIQGENRLPYSSMYRKRVWENIGGYRRRIRSGVEDADFWTRALSYGYKATLIDKVTLLYTLRRDSLRTVNQQGSAAWMGWFPWGKDSSRAPLGLTELGYRPLHSLDTPKVSVIIPVGPGHEPYIQACLDSLIAQTYSHWEAILINDTGKKWFEKGQPVSYYLIGTSQATLIDKNVGDGVAYARNLGVDFARSDNIVFLDVDDTAQPDMLAVLLAAQDQVGGWVYGDWLAVSGGQVTHKESDDWNPELLTNRSLGPITGLYKREHFDLVGGFDSSLAGWEDWDFHLKLLEKGICGTRVAYPLIAYNMNLGQRREDNFKQRDNLLQYISKRYTKLRNLVKDNNNMACRTCGGKATVLVKGNTVTLPKTASQPLASSVVEMMYVGPQTQIRTFRSKSHPGAIYRVSSKRPFVVYREDVQDFLRFNDFKVVNRAPQSPETVIAESANHLVVDNNQQSPSVYSVLGNLKTEVVNLIAAQFPTLADLRNADDQDMLSIKGIGPTRLAEVKREIAKWS